MKHQQFWVLRDAFSKRNMAADVYTFSIDQV
jgi:hypothetical protein